MKQLALLLIAALALVGCGTTTTPSEPETNAEPKVAAEKQEPPKTEPKQVGQEKGNHSTGKEPRHQGRVPVGQGVATGCGGGEL